MGMWRNAFASNMIALFFWSIAVGTSKAENSVLDLNDESSRKVLQQMASEGNLKNNKLRAEAWVVISSVAIGMGVEKCHFFTPDDMSFMWKPAQDAMSEDEIMTLNRVVTSNFRNSERNGQLLRDRLFPITRQAVINLSDARGNWDCREISRVWDAARSYVKNRNL
jgi:hypothetical protein